MDTITKPRNVAIFDDWKHCVAYVLPHKNENHLALVHGGDNYEN